MNRLQRQVTSALSVRRQPGAVCLKNLAELFFEWKTAAENQSLNSVN